MAWHPFSSYAAVHIFDDIPDPLTTPLRPFTPDGPYIEKLSIGLTWIKLWCSLYYRQLETTAVLLVSVLLKLRVIRFHQKTLLSTFIERIKGWNLEREGMNFALCIFLMIWERFQISWNLQSLKEILSKLCSYYTRKKEIRAHLNDVIQNFWTLTYYNLHTQVR